MPIPVPRRSVEALEPHDDQNQQNQPDDHNDSAHGHATRFSSSERRMTTKNLTAEQLRELLDYDPETGVFKWRVRRGAAIPGKVAGGFHLDGYIMIGIERRTYLAHRLAWLWMTGEWPPSEIDHKNIDKADNRWVNLRLATRSLNCGNKSHNRNNCVGVKGVTPQSGKYVANIMKDGRRYYLGFFETIEEASAAYESAAEKYFGEFARAS